MQSLRFNKKLIAFLCLAFLLRGLIPAGYMPDVRMLETGSIKLTICTAEGAKEISVDRDMHPVDSKNTDDTNHNKSNVCLYGASPQAGVLNYIAAIHKPAIDEATHISLRIPALAEIGPNPAARPRAPPV